MSAGISGVLVVDHKIGAEVARRRILVCRTDEKFRIARERGWANSRRLGQSEPEQKHEPFPAR